MYVANLKPYVLFRERPWRIGDYVLEALLMISTLIGHSRK